MSDNLVDFSPRRVLGTLGAYWKVIGVCALVGALLAGGKMLLDGPTYTAESQVLIGQPITLQSLTSPTGAAVDQERLVDMTTKQLESDTFARTVEKQLGLTEDDYEVDVLSATTTNVIGIKATANDAQRAGAVANTWATAYIRDVATTNRAKINRARTELRRDIQKISAQLAELEAAQTGAASALASAPQRNALIQQRLEVQSGLTQVKLAGSVDLAGGARLIERSTEGESSVFDVVARLLLGGLLGGLIGLALSALSLWRNRPEDEEPEASYPSAVRASA
jgi:uncharacterized protein involved in exopolysaccharide biosynthesis